MVKKKIALPDGRYLIYYTFGKQETKPESEKTSENCRDGKCCGGKK